MKKVVMLFAVAVFSMTFAFVACDDDETCNQDDTEKCAEEYVDCLSEAGSDTDAMEKCVSDLCDCYEDGGCEIPDEHEC